MAGIFSDYIAVEATKSDDSKDKDVNAAKVSTISAKQASELNTEMLRLRDITDNHLKGQTQGNVVKGLNVIETVLKEALEKDYDGKEESSLRVAFKAMRSSEEYARIAVTPENVDKLIKALKGAADSGLELKNEIIKNSGAKEISPDNMVRVELQIRNTLKENVRSIVMR